MLCQTQWRIDNFESIEIFQNTLPSPDISHFKPCCSQWIPRLSQTRVFISFPITTGTFINNHHGLINNTLVEDKHIVMMMRTREGRSCAWRLAPCRCSRNRKVCPSRVKGDVAMSLCFSEGRATSAQN